MGLHYRDSPEFFLLCADRCQDSPDDSVERFSAAFFDAGEGVINAKDVGEVLVGLATRFEGRKPISCLLGPFTFAGNDSFAFVR